MIENVPRFNTLFKNTSNIDYPARKKYGPNATVGTKASMLSEPYYYWFVNQYRETEERCVSAQFKEVKEGKKTLKDLEFRQRDSELKFEFLNVGEKNGKSWQFIGMRDSVLLRDVVCDILTGKMETAKNQLADALRLWLPDETRIDNIVSIGRRSIGFAFAFKMPQLLNRDCFCNWMTSVCEDAKYSTGLLPEALVDASNGDMLDVVQLLDRYDAKEEYPEMTPKHVRLLRAFRDAVPIMVTSEWFAWTPWLVNELNDLKKTTKEMLCSSFKDGDSVEKEPINALVARYVVAFHALHLEWTYLIEHIHHQHFQARNASYMEQLDEVKTLTQLMIDNGMFNSVTHGLRMVANFDYEFVAAIASTVFDAALAHFTTISLAFAKFWMGSTLKALKTAVKAAEAVVAKYPSTFAGYGVETNPVETLRSAAENVNQAWKAVEGAMSESDVTDVVGLADAIVSINKDVKAFVSSSIAAADAGNADSGCAMDVLLIRDHAAAADEACDCAKAAIEVANANFKAKDGGVTSDGYKVTVDDLFTKINTFFDFAKKEDDPCKKEFLDWLKGNSEAVRRLFNVLFDVATATSLSSYAESAHFFTIRRCYGVLDAALRRLNRFFCDSLADKETINKHFLAIYEREQRSLALIEREFESTIAAAADKAENSLKAVESEFKVKKAFHEMHHNGRNIDMCEEAFARHRRRIELVRLFEEEDAREERKQKELDLSNELISLRIDLEKLDRAAVQASRDNIDIALLRIGEAVATVIRNQEMRSASRPFQIHKKNEQMITEALEHSLSGYIIGSVYHEFVRRSRSYALDFLLNYVYIPPNFLTHSLMDHTYFEDVGDEMAFMLVNCLGAEPVGPFCAAHKIASTMVTYDCAVAISEKQGPIDRATLEASVRELYKIVLLLASPFATRLSSKHGNQANLRSYIGQDRARSLLMFEVLHGPSLRMLEGKPEGGGNGPPVWLLYGAPATGKTRLGKEAATALNKHFEVIRCNEGLTLFSLRGSDVGYTGSDENPPFLERMYANRERGTIILLDEYHSLSTKQGSVPPTEEAANKRIQQFFLSVFSGEDWVSALGLRVPMHNCIFVVACNACNEKRKETGAKKTILEYLEFNEEKGGASATSFLTEYQEQCCEKEVATLIASPELMSRISTTVAFVPPSLLDCCSLARIEMFSFMVAVLRETGCLLLWSLYCFTEIAHVYFANRNSGGFRSNPKLNKFKQNVVRVLADAVLVRNGEKEWPQWIYLHNVDDDNTILTSAPETTKPARATNLEPPTCQAGVLDIDLSWLHPINNLEKLIKQSAGEEVKVRKGRR